MAKADAEAGARDEQSLTVDRRQACDLIGVKQTTLASLVSSGQLRSFKIGRLRKFLRADINAFIEQQRSQVSNDY